MGSSMKEIASWLGMLGVPTIFVMTTWCVKSCVKFFKQLAILQMAQKAQMRSQMLDQYFKYKEQGFIYQDELDEWVNQYNAYHELKGPNAVLDARKQELLQMPVQVR